jgi:gliding motility-associated-like protein
LAAQPAPIVLQCANQSGGGNNELVWLPDTPACANFDGYIVFASTSANGPFAAVDTIPDPLQSQWVHANVNTPGGVWHYYLVQSCGGTLSPPSDTLDNQVPVRPVIEAVTIVNGQPLIVWQAGISPETAAYVVYIESPPGSGADVVVDTVWGDTFYLHTGAQATQRPERYRVTAMDACGEESLRSTPHKTMLLTQTTDRCTREVRLAWTLYEGWASGIGRHEIWLSSNGAPAQLLDSLPASATSYVHTAADGDTLCFDVRAIRNGVQVRSASNEVCLVPVVNRPVAYNLSLNASVAPANSGVDLTWLADNRADIASATAWAAPPGQVFSPLPAPPLPLPAPYNDFATVPGFADGPMSYVLQLTDSCGTVSGSDTMRTVFLQAVSGGNFTNILAWTPWVPAAGNLLGYEVWRQINGAASLKTTLPATADQFIDPVDPDTEADAELCYYVVALSEVLLPDSSLLPVETRSNTACAEQEAFLWAPSAFVPVYGSPNAEFRVITLFGATGEFSLQVFDRWGGRVFVSADAGLGWDGSKNGEPLPAGVYTWLVRLVRPDGQEVQQTGFVALIR